VSFGPVVMARFDEDTNKKLIAAKTVVTEASRGSLSSSQRSSVRIS
jgi:hypothetical protein